jgi:2-dehydropantoate 2-reductase
VRILVVGAGAIGCLVGAKLATAGVQVTLVGRPAFADAVRNGGVVLHEQGETVTVRAVQAVGSIRAAFSGVEGPDLAILTVKSYDTQAALDELCAAAAADPPVVVSLQNGVGNEEMIAAAMGSARVIAGTITTPVSVVAPGVIQIERPSHWVGLSSWAGAATGLVDQLKDAFAGAGFRVSLYADVTGMKWSKLLMNMVANATCAILDEDPATVFGDPALVDLELAAWREALAVMDHAGIRPVNLGKYPFRQLAPLIRTLPNALLRPALRSQVAGARGSKMPSLQIDLSAGKARSEVEWLNGAVAQKGQSIGVPTPVNQTLTRLLLSLVGEPQARSAWRHNHALLLSTVGNLRAVNV